MGAAHAELCVCVCRRVYASAAPSLVLLEGGLCVCVQPVRLQIKTGRMGDIGGCSRSRCLNTERQKAGHAWAVGRDVVVRCAVNGRNVGAAHNESARVRSGRRRPRQRIPLFMCVCVCVMHHDGEMATLGPGGDGGGLRVEISRERGRERRDETDDTSPWQVGAGGQSAGHDGCRRPVPLLFHLVYPHSAHTHFTFYFDVR